MTKGHNFSELRLTKPILLSNKFFMKGLELHTLISKGVIGDGANGFEYFGVGDLTFGESKPCM